MTTNTAQPTPAPLSRRTKIIFGLGDWGPTTAGTAIMFFFAFFLTDVAGLPPAYASIVLLIGGLWDAINDPIVGVLADRVHTRWGRRRPFFLFGALPFALTLIALWWVPPWSAPLARMIYYIVAYMVWDTVFTLVSVPYSALTPELTEDYDERTRLNGYRMVVSMAGGLIAAVSVPYVAGLFPQPKTGYLLMAAIFGVLGAFPYLLLFFGIRERFTSVPASQAPTGPRKWGDSILSIFRNRPFRYAAGIYLTSWMTIGLVAALFQYYLTYPMQMPDQVEIVLGLLQVSALICTAAAVWLATRWGKQQTYVVGVVWLSAIVISLTFLPPGAQPVVFALAVMAGFGVAIAQVIPWAMVPDVMEVDELATGQRREATYYGVLTFAQKGGTALALAMMQAVLALTGYVAGAQQPPATLLAIRLMMGPLPALLLAISVLLALRYPLTRQRHEEVRALLAERRNAAVSTD